MKKQILLAAATMVMGMAVIGCGHKEAAATEATTVAEATTAAEVTSEAETETEAAEVQAPVLADEEAYAEIISALPKGQFYAFADIDAKNDALLVTENTFEMEDGVKAAIDAKIYGLGDDGEIIEYGEVFSEGTAYPLSVYEGCLMFGGNHHVGMEYIENGCMVTKEDADEVFDEKGNAKYFYFSLDDKFEGEVENNEKLTALYDKYADAVVIDFTEVE